MIMEIRGHGGITHFGNSEGRGELKYGSRPWYGMDIFWNCPICFIYQNSLFSSSVFLLPPLTKISTTSFLIEQSQL